MPRRRPAWLAAIVAAAGNTVCVLPLFLAGAMAVQMGEELDYGAAGLGAAVASYWLANAVTSLHLGRLADRLGAIWSLRLAVVIAAVSAGGVALATARWWHLVVWLMIGGCSHAIGHPATNRMLVSLVRPERLGMAFGLKGVAPPVASSLAGLAVPLVALTVGWRWAFAASSAVAVLLILAAGRRPPPAQRTRLASGRGAKLRERHLVVALGGAFGLATAASTTVPAFYVDAAVTGGASPQFAGTMLAVASGGAVVTRLVSGAVCDRVGRGLLRICAVMLSCGAIGLVLMAVGRPATMAVGVVVALMGTWGFNVMFWVALMRRYHDVPGRITGAIQPGAAIGGIIGPLVFGVVVTAASYRAAWSLSIALTALAVVAMFFGARRLEPAATARR